MRVTLLPVAIAVGDTLPRPAAAVDGLESDPTGAVATWEMVRRGSVDVVSEGAASVQIAAAWGGRWDIELSAILSDTTDLEPGEHYLRFRLELAGSTMTVPTDGALRVFVSK